MAANAGVNVCLRKVEAKAIFDAIREHRVTHYCGAPIVHLTLINAPAQMKTGIEQKVQCFVAGAAPPAAVIEGDGADGLRHHPRLRPDRNLRAGSGVREARGMERARHRRAPPSATAGRGVRYTVEEGMTVMDPDTMVEVPWDGETMGEIMFRGNVHDEGLPQEPDRDRGSVRRRLVPFRRSRGDAADGYVKIKDRSKDIIISGGENISSLEVEDALYRHPAVLAAAVVAQPDAKWGETPCAFVS
jgi:fatty-acyl-CoA synthase